MHAPGKFAVSLPSRLFLIAFLIHPSVALADERMFRSSFHPFPVGSSPVRVATSDLNGDGREDLITANIFSRDVTVLLGRDDGGFDRLPDTPLPEIPASIAIADFNGDVHPDLALGGQWQTFMLLLGEGDGSFMPATQLTIGTSPNIIAAADLNGDGRADLVTADQYNSAVSVVLGNGNGTFGLPRTFPVGARPSWISIGHIDGDGFPDLAVTDFYGPVSVLLGTGDGSFAPSVGVMAPGNSVSVAIGDLNGDETADLVVLSESGLVSVLIGQGDGSFGGSSDYMCGQRPIQIELVDVNEDGNPDVSVAVSLDYAVGVLLNTGNGTLSACTRYPAGQQPMSLAAGDFDDDGHVDIAATSGAFGTPGTVTVLTGNGDGSFGDAARFPTGASPVGIAARDLDGDGLLDVATANSGSATISILKGFGAGRFSAPFDFESGAVAALTVADLNEDGRPDLISTGEDRLSVFLGLRDGGFGSRATWPVGSAPIAVAIGDFSEDGHLDAVVANQYDNSMSVLPGSGDGTFGPAEDYAAGYNPAAVAIGDLNGDGHLDLVCAAQYTNVLNLWFGRGDGSFDQPADVVVGWSPSSVVVADANADGLADLIVTRLDGNVISVVIGNGNGTFRPAVDHPVSEYPVGLAAGDVNGDGTLDLVAAGELANTVSVLLGKGDGTFHRSIDVGAGAYPISVAIGDANNDGRPDILVGNLISNDVAVLLNKLPALNQLPVCAGAIAEPAILWPPNHALVPISITGIADPDSDAITIQVTGVTQNERASSTSDADICPDAVVTEAGLSLRAERSGKGKDGRGRIYYVDFTASDGRGGQCAGQVRVCVPHDMGWASCQDDSVTIDALAACGTRLRGPDVPLRTDMQGEPGMRVWRPAPGGRDMVIDYVLSKGGMIALEAYDVTGRLVATFESGFKAPGEHSVRWDTTGLPSGFYYIRMEAQNFVKVERVAVVK